MAALIFIPAPAAQAACEAAPVVLQVLGSGGPFGNGRASSGYLIWIDGVARVLVDAGGGTFTRFHNAGASVDDLRLLALSHFHPDHAFAEFASGAEVLVVHVALPEAASGIAATLHAKPSVWGQMATEAGVGTLVLSHLTNIAPRNSAGDLPGFGKRLAHLRSEYEGPLVIAEDLICVPVK